MKLIGLEEHWCPRELFGEEGASDKGTGHLSALPSAHIAFLR